MTFTLFARRLFVALLTSLMAAAAVAATGVNKTYTVTAPDGVTLSVQEAGKPDGPPIIFIHGLLGSHLNWSGQLRSPQLQGYRLITYDMRGHGLSGKPTDPGAYTDGRRWADDLAAVIEASGAKKPVVVSWSLGAAVISNYLATYGDDRLAGAVYVAGVVELKPEQIVSHPELYRNLVSPELETHLNAVREFLSLCFRKKPDTATFERLLANAAMASWDMQRSVQSMSVAAAEGLGRARVPVLLLYGAHDDLVQSLPSMARAAAINPRVQRKLYAETGHAPFLEEPQRFDRDLAAFVAATGAH